MERQRPPPQALPTAVSPIAYYLPAAESAKHSVKDTDPRLVIIFGWMDAKLSHIMKYSTKYSALYPAASQILIQSDAGASYSASAKFNTDRMQPVVKLLSECGLFSVNPPGIIFHVFSAGGTAQLLWLARALKATPRPNPPGPTPPTGIIFDSTPGAFTYAALHRIMTVPLKGYQKLLGSVGVPIMWILDKTNPLLSLRPTMQTFIHQGISSPRILDWTDAATPRLYLYSDTDPLILVGDVRKHIAGAQSAGFRLSAEEFHGSGHVQHATLAPERYWTAVEALWGDVVRAKL
ncbi:hypothetical protein C8R46DRAFT_959174 [Mycena filopes]|nr:hypothetical protein C8R46DRAFT_959174 [Mycena filopes]